MIGIRCRKESAKLISAAVCAVSVDWTLQIILLVFQFVRIRELSSVFTHYCWTTACTSAASMLMNFAWNATGLVQIKPRLHDTTCCQPIVKPIDNRLYRVYKHSTDCQVRLTTGLTTCCIVYTAGCQTGCKTGLIAGCIV